MPQTTSSGRRRQSTVKLDVPADAGRSVGASRKESPIQQSASRPGITFAQTNPDPHPQDERLVGPMTTTDVAVAGRSCKALLDTGSQVTTITDEFVSTHPQLQFQTLQKTDINIQGAGDQSVPHHGYILLTVQVLGEEVKDVPTLVVPVTDF